MRSLRIFIHLAFILAFIWPNTLFSASYEKADHQDKVKRYLIVSNAKYGINRKYREGGTVTIWLKSDPGISIKGKLSIQDDHTIMINGQSYSLADISRMKILPKIEKMISSILGVLGVGTIMGGLPLLSSNLANGYFGAGMIFIGIIILLLIPFVWLFTLPRRFRIGEVWRLSIRSILKKKR
ncbi:MAG: hypothetical protein R3B93_23665 [Bacteroidia bacterium]